MAQHQVPGPIATTDRTTVTQRADELFGEVWLANCQRTDQWFAGLFIFQYLAGIAAALWITPRTWLGTQSEVHLHVWAAIFLGALIISLPLFLVWRHPGQPVTRHIIAVAQMLASALLIHLTGGRIETHFHIFGSLAFLAFYRDWRVLITGSAIVAADHFIRGIWWPQSVFGVLTSSPYRAFEHTAWVVFEDLFLIRSCRSGVREMRELTDRQAQLESTTAIVEAKVAERTQQLRASQDELSRSESRLRGIFESAVDGIVTIDQQGLIQSLNPAAEQLFGYRQEECLGENVKMLMPSPFRDEHDQYLRDYLEHGQRNVLGTGREVEGLRKDGSRFPIELSVSEVMLYRERLFTGIVRDITERHHARRQLLAQAQQLEQQNHELIQLKEQAEQANVAKSQFLANMSHELRTPMNAIIGYSEMLEEELQDMGEDACVNDVRRIHRAGKQLLTLINDILDLSKIEAGKMDIHPTEFSLSAFLDEACSIVQPLIKEKSNRLVLEPCAQTVTLFNDQTKLRQSLLNLLSNAAKFTENGTVTLRAHSETVDGTEWLTLEVQDDGIGMTAEQQTKVFDAFTQAEGSTTRKFGGTGLGLTITNHFCSMMGGQISVRSQLHQGTTFTIRVPVHLDGFSESAVPSTRTNSAAEVKQQGQVLVIDDDPDVLDLVSRFLNRNGFAVLTASSGREGLDLAVSRQPIAITLDVMMPGLDGWSVLKHLKENEATSHIPVIMMSMVDNQDLGFALGVTDYLTKPVNRDRLLTLLMQLKPRTTTNRILVVEDDPGNRQMLVRWAGDSGYDVAQATNGTEALSRVAEQLPDLILLDLMMPEMDGFDFVQELNEQGLVNRIPIIVLTAKDLTEDDQQRLRGRVNSIHHKGEFSRDTLLQEICVYLQAFSRKPTETEP